MRFLPLLVVVPVSVLGCAVDATPGDDGTELTIVDDAYVGVLGGADLEWLDLGSPETVLLFQDLDWSEYETLGLIEPDGFRVPLSGWLDVVGRGIPASTFPAEVWAVGAQPERVDSSGPHRGARARRRRRAGPVEPVGSRVRRVPGGLARKQRR